MFKKVQIKCKTWVDYLAVLLLIGNFTSSQTIFDLSEMPRTSLFEKKVFNVSTWNDLRSILIEGTDFIYFGTGHYTGKIKGRFHNVEYNVLGELQGCSGTAHVSNCGDGRAPNRFANRILRSVHHDIPFMDAVLNDTAKKFRHFHAHVLRSSLHLKMRKA